MGVSALPAKSECGAAFGACAHAEMRFLEADNFPSYRTYYYASSRAHIMEPHFWVYGLLPSLPKEVR